MSLSKFRDIDEKGWIVSLSGNSEVLAIGNPYNNVVYVYHDVSNINSSGWGDPYILTGKDNAHFGASIKLDDSGLRMIIGAPQDDDMKGLVYLYEFHTETNKWETITTVEGIAKNGKFGSHVTISPNGAVVASCTDDTDNDYVSIYNFGEGHQSTILDGQIKHMCSSLSFNNDGSLLAVGVSEYVDDDGVMSGAVFVYGNKGKTEWAKVKCIYGDVSDGLFGLGVSMSHDGNILAVSAPYEDNGVVRVYDIGAESLLLNTIKGANRKDLFGINISLSGDGRVVVIGAPFANNSQGYIQIWYSRGVEIGESIIGTEINGYFGYNVAISNDCSLIVSGALGDMITSTSSEVGIFQLDIPEGLGFYGGKSSVTEVTTLSTSSSGYSLYSSSYTDSSASYTGSASSSPSMYSSHSEAMSYNDLTGPIPYKIDLLSRLMSNGDLSCNDIRSEYHTKSIEGNETESVENTINSWIASKLIDGNRSTATYVMNRLDTIVVDDSKQINESRRDDVIEVLSLLTNIPSAMLTNVCDKLDMTRGKAEIESSSIKTIDELYTKLLHTDKDTFNELRSYTQSNAEYNDETLKNIMIMGNLVDKLVNLPEESIDVMKDMMNNYDEHIAKPINNTNYTILSEYLGISDYDTWMMHAYYVQNDDNPVESRTLSTLLRMEPEELMSVLCMSGPVPESNIDGVDPNGFGKILHNRLSHVMSGEISPVSYYEDYNDVNTADRDDESEYTEYEVEYVVEKKCECCTNTSDTNSNMICAKCRGTIEDSESREFIVSNILQRITSLPMSAIENIFDIIDNATNNASSDVTDTMSDAMKAVMGSRDINEESKKDYITKRLGLDMTAHDDIFNAKHRADEHKRNGRNSRNTRNSKERNLGNMIKLVKGVGMLNGSVNSMSAKGKTYGETVGGLVGEIAGETGGSMVAGTPGGVVAGNVGKVAGKTVGGAVGSVTGGIVGGTQGVIESITHTKSRSTSEYLASMKGRAVRVRGKTSSLHRLTNTSNARNTRTSNRNVMNRGIVNRAVVNGTASNTRNVGNTRTSNTRNVTDNGNTMSQRVKSNRGLLKRTLLKNSTNSSLVSMIKDAQTSQNVQTQAVSRVSAPGRLNRIKSNKGKKRGTVHTMRPRHRQYRQLNRENVVKYVNNIDDGTARELGKILGVESRNGYGDIKRLIVKYFNDIITEHDQ